MLASARPSLMTFAMTHRWYLRGVVAALGLSAVAFGLGLVGFFRISHARRASLREWNTNRCSVYVSSHSGVDDPCAEPSRESPTLFSSLKEARVDIARAKAAIARHDDAAAARELAVAFDRANAVERRSSMFATMIAARIVSEALDVTDANPSVARRPEVRAALVRTSLPTARSPLEADRLRMANAALNDPSSRAAFITWGATDARISDLVEHDDAAMVSMQRAVRDGDRAACERAGKNARVGPYVCASLVRSVTTAKRLSAVSARGGSLTTDQRLDLRSR